PQNPEPCRLKALATIRLTMGRSVCILFRFKMPKYTFRGVVDMLRKSFLFTVVLTLLAAVAAAVETKDIRFTFKNSEPVVFSHESHLKKYNNNCKICHDAIFNLRNRKHVTMAEMEKTKSCGACHSGIKAFSVASDKDCVKCHKGKPRDISYRIKG